MTALGLVMPMAGLGSRFSRAGVAVPKPLIEVGGRPFFWWAVESVRRAAPLRELVFVVLETHVASHGIDRRIAALYPGARVIALPEPTSGAAETAAAGVAALCSDGPIAINDCDHAFAAARLQDIVDKLAAGAAAALVGFASDNPAFSYARLDPRDPTRVLGAVEKRCVGPYAIAGCYLFRDRATFERALADYRVRCPYEELFLSGLYDLLCEQGATVLFEPLGAHTSFGTPEDLARVTPAALAELSGVEAS